MRLISQLIKSISKVVKKLLKFFHDTAIFTFFVLPEGGINPVVLMLNLNDSDYTRSLLAYLCDIATNFLMPFNNYH